MSDPIKPTLQTEPIKPAAPVVPTPPVVKPVEFVKPVEAAPVVTPPVEPVKPAEIEKVSSLSDAIAVKLGEKVVKPAVAPGDDAELNKEIDAATKGFDPKAKDSWSKKTYELRDANRKLKELEVKAAEAEALRKEVETLKTAAPAASADTEALKKQLADLDAEVAAVRLEKTVAYKTQIGEPLAASLKMATELGVKGEIKEADVLAAINDVSADRGKKLGDVLANLTEFDKARFVNAVERVDGLRSKAAELQANAKASLEAMTAKEISDKATADVARKAAYDAAVPVAWTEISTAVPVLAPIDGASAWNDGLKVAQDFAKNDFGVFDPKSQVTIMQRAGVFPLLQGTIAHQASQIAALEADLAKFRAGSPPAGPTGTTPPPVKTNEKETFSEAISRRLATLGVS